MQKKCICIKMEGIINDSITNNNVLTVSLINNIKSLCQAAANDKLIYSMDYWHQLITIMHA